MSGVKIDKIYYVVINYNFYILFVCGLSATTKKLLPLKTLLKNIINRNYESERFCPLFKKKLLESNLCSSKNIYHIKETKVSLIADTVIKNIP